MRDCVKFPGDWSHRSEDRAMCQFFTMAAVCQLVSFLWVWVTHRLFDGIYHFSKFG